MPSDYVRRIQDQVVRVQDDPSNEQWQEASGGKLDDQGRYAEFVSRSLNGANMNVGVDWLEPGETHLLHYHANVQEWYYVVRGTGQFRLYDEEIRGEPGTGIYIPPGAPHRVYNDGTETLEFLYGFDCGELNEVEYVWLE